MNVQRRIGSALLLLVGLALAGCGRDGEDPVRSASSSFVGTWILDPEATHARMKEAGILVDLAAVQKTRITIALSVDGSYVGMLEDGSTTTRATGTWKAEGEELTLTALEQNGQPADRPESKTGMVRDGRVWFDADAKTAPLVLRRR